MSVILRRFVKTVSVAFHGAHSFQTALTKWRKALATLTTESRDLARRFGRLKVRQAPDGTVLLGRIEARRFATLLRRGRVIEAFEGATGALLPSSVQRALQRLEISASRLFPDAMLARRADYLTRVRDASIHAGYLSRGEFVHTAERLQALVRSDAKLLARTNRLARVSSVTKRILYVGGAITATSTGVAYLCRLAATHAARNSGCFMYIGGGQSIRKCKVVGCSCPLRVDEDERSCTEDFLWEKMRLANSACHVTIVDDDDSKSASSFHCVHCDWNETNRDSINYVDREVLPDNAYVCCEHQDALDALNEMIGGTIEDAWNVGREITKGASDSLNTIVRFLPYVIFALAFLVVATVIVHAIRVYKAYVR